MMAASAPLPQLLPVTHPPTHSSIHPSIHPFHPSIHPPTYPTIHLIPSHPHNIRPPRNNTTTVNISGCPKDKGNDLCSLSPRTQDIPRPKVLPTLKAGRRLGCYCYFIIAQQMRQPGGQAGDMASLNLGSGRSASLLLHRHCLPRGR